MSSRFNILVVDDIHPLLLDRLSQFPGVEVHYQPKIAVNDIPEQLRQMQGLVIRTKCFVSSELMAAAPQLRWIARAGAGLDNIDEAAARTLGIALLNAPEGNRDAVAEHVLGMLLALFNHLPRAHQEVTQGLWRREANRGTELMGKTIGLIGYGNNGQATARKLSGFEVKVLAYDKYRRAYSDAYAEEASPERLFESCDILSLHLPLTHESRGMVDAAFLNRFEKPIWLINAARGELVKLPDLYAAIKSGQLKGACLDVLENEKFDQLTAAEKALYEQLAQSGKVLFSPHIAGWTHESYYKIAAVLADKIQAWLEQQPARSV